MDTPNPVSVVTIGAAVPFYKSKVQISQVAAMVSALVALSPKLGKLIGVNTPAEAEVWVETVFGFITLVAPIAGAIWRARSTMQPLTLTQAKADAHPATIAVTTTAAVPVPSTATGVPHVAHPAVPQTSALLDIPFVKSSPPAGQPAVSPPGAPVHAAGSLGSNGKPPTA